MKINIQSRSNAFLLASALLLTAFTFSSQAWSEDAPKSEQRVEPRPHGGGGYGNRDNNWAPSNRAAPAAGGGPGPRGGGEHFDRDRYHPQVGAGFDRLPPGYQRYSYRGDPYFFRGGIWYRQGGPGYVVARPPRGLLLYTLPPFFVTRWYGGVPYYYYDDTYYLWDSTQRGYIVTDPPGSVPSSNAPDGASNDIFVYPTQNQSPDQQAKDRYDCYRWAADQTGFDPTKPEGGVDSSASTDRRGDYRRAETACLTGRGYSVK